MGITDHQQAVLDFSRDFRADKGVMPSLREIPGHFKFGSSHAAHQRLQTLEEGDGDSKKRESGAVHDDDWNGSR